MKSFAMVALIGAAAAAPQDWNAWTSVSPSAPVYTTSPVPVYTTTVPVYSTTTSAAPVYTTTPSQWGQWQPVTTPSVYPTTTPSTSAWVPWTPTTSVLPVPTTYVPPPSYSWSEWTSSSAAPVPTTSWAVWSQWSTTEAPKPTTYVPTTIVPTTKVPTSSVPVYTTTTTRGPQYTGAADSIKAPVLGAGFALVMAALAL